MNLKIESWSVWILVRLQLVTENFDPEVLQWPGGSLIAFLLWLMVMARWFWSVATGGSSALRG